MRNVSSLPHRLLAQRFFALRGAFLEVQCTTDYDEYEHGRSVELMADEMYAMETLIHRLGRMKEKQI